MILPYKFFVPLSFFVDIVVSVSKLLGGIWQLEGFFLWLSNDVVKLENDIFKLTDNN